MIFQTGGGGSLGVKPVSLICKMLHKLLRRTAVATKFCKDKLYPGTAPLTVENLNNLIC
jgi:hypothetical protein